MHSDTKVDRREGCYTDARKILKRRSGLRPSEKDVPEEHSCRVPSQKYPGHKYYMKCCATEES
jgi:hypothetical protein